MGKKKMAIFSNIPFGVKSGNFGGDKRGKNEILVIV